MDGEHALSYTHLVPPFILTATHGDYGDNQTTLGETKAQSNSTLASG